MGKTMEDFMRKDFWGVLLFSFILASVFNAPLYAAGSTEQEANKLDANGLRQEDYDANGWAYKDGKWLAVPTGAVKDAKNQTRIEIINQAGILIEGVGFSAEGTEEPVVYTCSFKNGESFSFLIEKNKVYDVVFLTKKENVYAYKQITGGSGSVTLTKDDVIKEKTKAGEVVDSLMELWFIFQLLKW
jgi:hypothetical protein